MSVRITDTRIIINNANATTGWTGTITMTPTAADPSPIEGTNCLGMVVSNTTQNAYFTSAGINFSPGANRKSILVVHIKKLSIWRIGKFVHHIIAQL